MYFNKFFKIESSPRDFIFAQVQRKFPMLGALFLVGQYLVNRSTGGSLRNPLPQLTNGCILACHSCFANNGLRTTRITYRVCKSCGTV